MRNSSGVAWGAKGQGTKSLAWSMKFPRVEAPLEHFVSERPDMKMTLNPAQISLYYKDREIRASTASSVAGKYWDADYTTRVLLRRVRGGVGI